MTQPKFKSGDKVVFSLNGEQLEDTVLNVFPVGRGHDGQPIIKPVQQVQYSYQVHVYRNLRINEAELKAAPTKKASS